MKRVLIPLIFIISLIAIPLILHAANPIYLVENEGKAADEGYIERVEDPSTLPEAYKEAFKYLLRKHGHSDQAKIQIVKALHSGEYHMHVYDKQKNSANPIHIYHTKNLGGGKIQYIHKAYSSSDAGNYYLQGGIIRGGVKQDEFVSNFQGPIIEALGKSKGWYDHADVKEAFKNSNIKEAKFIKKAEWEGVKKFEGPRLKDSLLSNVNKVDNTGEAAEIRRERFDDYEKFVDGEKKAEEKLEKYSASKGMLWQGELKGARLAEVSDVVDSRGKADAERILKILEVKNKNAKKDVEDLAIRNGKVLDSEKGIIKVDAKYAAEHVREDPRVMEALSINLKHGGYQAIEDVNKELVSKGLVIESEGKGFKVIKPTVEMVEKDSDYYHAFVASKENTSKAQQELDTYLASIGKVATFDKKGDFQSENITLEKVKANPTLLKAYANLPGFKGDITKAGQEFNEQSLKNGWSTVFFKGKLTEVTSDIVLSDNKFYNNLVHAEGKGGAKNEMNKLLFGDGKIWKNNQPIKVTAEMVTKDPKLMKTFVHTEKNAHKEFAAVMSVDKVLNEKGEFWGVGKAEKATLDKVISKPSLYKVAKNNSDYKGKNLTQLLDQKLLSSGKVWDNGKPQVPNAQMVINNPEYFGAFNKSTIGDGVSKLNKALAGTGEVWGMGRPEKATAELYKISLEKANVLAKAGGGKPAAGRSAKEYTEAILSALKAQGGEKAKLDKVFAAEGKVWMNDKPVLVTPAMVVKDPKLGKTYGKAGGDLGKINKILHKRGQQWKDGKVQRVEKPKLAPTKIKARSPRKPKALSKKPTSKIKAKVKKSRIKKKPVGKAKKKKKEKKKGQKK